ncbi:MAG: hypothetical protein Q8Q08_08105 [Candidatus Omnitrophota bacterium]|nr:hypothetical protein [Candidatus Omnitrophota bacterium]MDZ4242074.1 hypothetical protein [Candidatus Omnitrophota bacterium]
MAKFRVVIAAVCFLITGFTTDIHATALSGPTCQAQAEILEVGSEKRTATGANGEAREYDVPYVKMSVLKLQPTLLNGYCGMLRLGQVVKTNGGSSPDSLKAGQIIEAGVEAAAAMGPEGVIPFLQWQPIRFLESRGEAPLPRHFHLQSEALDGGVDAGNNP